MSNPYHVVLNRQSSGERGAFVNKTTVMMIKRDDYTNETESDRD